MSFLSNFDICCYFPQLKPFDSELEDVSWRVMLMRYIPSSDCRSLLLNLLLSFWLPLSMQDSVIIRTTKQSLQTRKKSDSTDIPARQTSSDGNEIDC